MAFVCRMSLFSRYCRGSSKVKARSLVTGGEPTVVLDEDRAFVCSSQGEDSGDRPMVVLFGWAGAKHKHLDKYSKVYRDLGCDTLQYILPTRFIFRHTDQVPEALGEVASHLSSNPRPLAVHCLSDTGVMTAQGLSLALASQEIPFKPAGIVWDSCPGPRPVVTIPRGLVLCIINWLSRMRDGMPLWQAVTSSGRDFKDLAWDNYILRMKGQETVISTMEGTWTGYWARDQQLGAKELFLYSKSDFYIPYKYLEESVIPVRKKLTKEVRVRRWEKSPHVGHLRANTKDYTEEIKQFLSSIQFLQI